MEILKLVGAIVWLLLVFGHLFADAYDWVKAKLKYDNQRKNTYKNINSRINLYEFREQQIRNPTIAGNKFAKLCSEVLPGIQVLREEICGPFIMDFYIPSVRLCVEIDGRVHLEPKQRIHDQQRTAYLNKTHGIRVIRFTNDEVLRSPDYVMWILERNVKIGDLSTGN